MNRLLNESGFSILEAIAVIAIISICLVPLMGMFPLQLVNSRSMENYTQDISLARKKTEEIKTRLFSDFQATIPDSGSFSSDSFPNYNYEVQLSSRTAADTICTLKVKVWETSRPQDIFEVNTKIARR